MKKIVRLTESKLVELIRGIVSEQQTMSPEEKQRIDSLPWKERERLMDLNMYNSDLVNAKNSRKITPAQFMQKYNAANPQRKIKTPNDKIIPYITSTKFLPPEIKHDEEVTKPEPPEEPEVKSTYTPEPEPEIEPVPAPQLQESIKRTLNMFNRIK